MPPRMKPQPIREITYSKSIKINRGNYEQEAPMFSCKSILTNPTQEEELSEYKRLQQIIDPMLEAQYDLKRTDLANVRIRVREGKKFPSVNSVLCPEGLPKSIKNLAQYCERGNQLDRIVKTYLTTGVQREPKVEDFSPLPWEYDVPKFLTDNKLFDKEQMGLWKQDIEVFNTDLVYSGEIDLLYNDKVVLDVKSGQWDWSQLIAYAKCLKDISHVAILDFKNNKFIKLPITHPTIVEAWEHFIYRRGEFKARFGI